MNFRPLPFLAMLLCAVVARAAAPAPAPLKIEVMQYASRVDGTAPLLAEVAYLPDGKPKPLLVVMHGYGGQKSDVARDVRDLAARGVFAVAPDMRGKGGSAGEWDSGGLDVHDILDAVLAAVEKYPGEIDAKNLNIVGYSGGGGNAIACAVRFPDLFQTAVSFFGISDYAGWHRSNGRPDCNVNMEAALGGGPDALPEVYAARNAIPAAGNARATKLHFLWDTQETMCPPSMIEAFLKTYRKAGLKAAEINVTKPGDARRWVHNYRTSNKDLVQADALFLPDVLAAKKASPALPPKGKLVVPGYLVTRHFSVWIGDSRGGHVKGRVEIAYDLTGKEPKVTVLQNPGEYEVKVETGTPLAKLPR